MASGLGLVFQPVLAARLQHQVLPIFGLPVITFWQAVGLMGLSWILFGSWRGGRALGGWRGRMRGRFDAMTPEERERFRQGLRGRCAPPAAPAS